MKFRVYGKVPICEGSEERDVVMKDFEVDTLGLGAGQLNAEMKFRKTYPINCTIIGVRLLEY